MKLRNYKKHTFSICMAWAKHPTTQNTAKLTRNLQRWARFTGHGVLESYGYEGPAISHVPYCSDRMNQGRAKAILTLLKDQ